MSDRFVEIVPAEPTGDERCEVFVSAIRPRSASKVLNYLTERIPMSELNLTHLKRIKSSGPDELYIIVTTLDHFRYLPAIVIQELENLDLILVKCCVPALPPVSREAFERCSSCWPTVFHVRANFRAAVSSAEIEVPLLLCVC
jgi:hypothetical protein